MVISNLKIGTSYFFTLLKEFAKENIRYLIVSNLYEHEKMQEYETEQEKAKMDVA